ncbi:MAG: type II toxin-antitoxin system PemK/MazF family toxin [bacterium]
MVVVPLTSNLRWAPAPGNVLLKARRTGLPKDSVANISQIVAVDRHVLTDHVGRVPRAQLDLILPCAGSMWYSVADPQLNDLRAIRSGRSLLMHQMVTSARERSRVRGQLYAVRAPINQLQENRPVRGPAYPLPASISPRILLAGVQKEAKSSIWASCPEAPASLPSQVTRGTPSVVMRK